ncbi:hypothetical protein DVH24_014987 [Malus domestica]|uniref:C3H1-type domain-containing protein n=1 Tax=Malus domestica TaxID=3750 RepID=A0A498K2T1_MALDO|nr:hypothetical protein DVH24_014987 [Malus domestica]
MEDRQIACNLGDSDGKFNFYLQAVCHARPIHNRSSYLSWKEDDLSFEIKDYKGFDLLMGALFFRHKKWPARFCHYGIKCKFNHPSLQRGQPNCLSQFNMITDKVPARVRERDPPTEKRRWTI